MTPLRIILLSILAVLLAIEFVWQSVGHFGVDMIAYLPLLGIFTAFMAVSMFYEYRRKDRAVSSLLFGLGFLIAFGSTSTVLNNFALTIAGPAIDGTLAAADRALGIRWPALMQFAAAHADLSRMLQIAYLASVWQVVVILIIFGFKDRDSTIEQLCLALALSGIATIAIWIVFPSFGAIVVYGLSDDLAAKVAPAVDQAYANSLMFLKLHGPPALISPDTVKGMVGFPSFHMIDAVICAWYARKLGWMFYVFAAFEIVVIASTPVQGGHHVVDIFGGLVVAIFAIYLAERIARGLGAIGAHSRISSLSAAPQGVA